MIDTHAHIYLDNFNEDLDEVMDRAHAAGLSHIFMPNIDPGTTDDMHAVHDKYPETCKPMMGLHPCSVNQHFKTDLEKTYQALKKGNYWAVGEMGTDLYWDKTYWEQQQEAFNIQCEWGLEFDLPIVIHCRDSIEETIELVKPWAQKGLRGVFHCFTGNEAQARAITSMDFFLGIGGVSTFKNGGVKEVLPSLERSKVVLETDSPYLAPTPNRGKRNEPAFVQRVAEQLAQSWGVDIQQVDDITTANAKELFRLG